MSLEPTENILRLLDAAPRFVHNEASGERRRGRRFPIQLRIHFKILYSSIALEGAGTTLDFSASGIAFKTEHQVAVGSVIEFAVDWPAMLNGDCALKFVGSGPVVRSNSGRVAVRTLRYEFRTRGKAS